MTHPKRFVLLALASFALIATVAAPRADESSGAAPPITIALVRHAEAQKLPGERDPELAEAGRARAEDLARLLSAAGVTHLYSSEFRRTRTTLAPLAERLELEVETIPAADGPAQIEALKSLPPGSVAVVAGHSNTVPALVAALGCEARDCVDDPRYGRMFPHDAYDRVILVTLPADGTPSHALELRY